MAVSLEDTLGTIAKLVTIAVGISSGDRRNRHRGFYFTLEQ